MGTDQSTGPWKWELVTSPFLASSRGTTGETEGRFPGEASLTVASHPPVWLPTSRTLKTREGTSSERWRPPCHLYVTNFCNYQFHLYNLEACACAVRWGAQVTSPCLSLPLLCCVHMERHGAVKVPVSSCGFPLLCKRTVQAARQLIPQIKRTQLCFRSWLYFIRFVSEHLINKGK